MFLSVLSTYETNYPFQLSLAFIRYFSFSGFAYFVFWQWNRERLAKFRIQKGDPATKTLAYEILWSIVTLMIFSAIGVFTFWLKQKGYTQIYSDVSAHGWLYLFVSCILTLVIHDTYFYWTHRLMHHPRLFKHLHLTHHRSLNPTPWSSYSFHPIEAIIEALIFPILAVIIPLHMIAVVFFVIASLGINILGHLGYEFFPKGSTTHKWGKYLNTSVHHNMHHQFFKQNYGLYFNFWDRICKTNHPKYHEVFEGISQQI
jgi:lathosterol oxidase